MWELRRTGKQTLMRLGTNYLDQKGAIGVMDLKYVLARDKYKPVEGIRVLFVAESPPASGGYFYFEKATGKDSLFRETMKALGLFPESSRMQKDFDKTHLLEEFRLRGFFVLDVCYRPVDKGLSAKERKIAIMSEMPRLVADVQELDPEKIIIVKANVFAPVKDALEEAGFGEKILNKSAIPFPSHGKQKIYRETVRKLIQT